MLAKDTRIPCSSCGRQDDKLRTCPKCNSRICSFCWLLHLEYDHKDDGETKLITFNPED